ncbi:MAG: hypothetical protein WC365_02610 [Candidatus Babeliales bacterium]|jgi:hypothetical protein
MNKLFLYFCFFLPTLVMNIAIGALQVDIDTVKIEGDKDFFLNELPDQTKEIQFLDGAFNFHFIAEKCQQQNATISRTITYHLYELITTNDSDIYLSTQKIVSLTFIYKPGYHVQCTTICQKIANAQFKNLHQWQFIIDFHYIEALQDMIKNILKTELFIIIGAIQKNMSLTCDWNSCTWHTPAIQKSHINQLSILPNFKILKCGHCFHFSCFSKATKTTDQACPRCGTESWIEDSLFLAYIPKSPELC